ncbi:N-acetyltransferase [Planotetraspora mira]|uniref:N-acetyltransferase n=2 Tax=Planotetraspora mira TaxID=58121 RepID=A0A8J3XET0_9ACTN|nr:N-acetyltransferase [Planotetraspora mira]
MTYDLGNEEMSIRTTEVRRLSPEDWALFRDVRLEALAESPDAFSSTLEREQAYDEEHWRDWMRPERGLKAVARAGETAVGLVGGWLPEDRGGAVELYSMWVSPAARERGVGALLVEEVVAWAAAEGHPVVELWVVDGNDQAERLYARSGFTMTGETQPHPNDPGLRERLMIRPLDS